MYLLVLIQNNDETPLALFERIEDGRKFVQSIPGYRRWEEISVRCSLSNISLITIRTRTAFILN